MADIGFELRETLSKEIQVLNDMRPDDPGYATQIECVNKLTRLILEHDSALDELEFKKNSAKSEQKHKIIGHVINGAGIVLPIWAYNRFVKQGFEFEKTGAITSFTFKDALRKIRFWK